MTVREQAAQSWQRIVGHDSGVPRAWLSHEERVVATFDDATDSDWVVRVPPHGTPSSDRFDEGAGTWLGPFPSEDAALAVALELRAVRLS